MKHLYAFSFYAKVDMIAWLVESFTANFTPAQAEFGIFFDDVDRDDSKLAFDSVRPWWLDQRGYKVHVATSRTPVREVGCHLGLIDLFLKTGCDTLIVAQDDQHLNQPIIKPYEELVKLRGPKLGIVGGRDGFERGYANMASSAFSASSGIVVPLAHGECRERPLLNSGPLIYPRHLLEKIGGPDPRFHAFYAWEEFCGRAMKNGFQNCVMGMDITHVKFGRVTATNWYTPEIAAADLALFKQLQPEFA